MSVSEAQDCPKAPELRVVVICVYYLIVVVAAFLFYDYESNKLAATKLTSPKAAAWSAPPREAAVERKENEQRPEQQRKSYGEKVENTYKQEWLSAIRGLCKAIVDCDVDLVSRVLKASPSLIKTRHDSQWLPLHAAVLSGSLTVVQLILDQPGVDVSAPDKSNPESVDVIVRENELGACSLDTKGATPLHYACMLGNVPIIEALIERGADFSALDAKKRTPEAYFDVRVHVQAMEVYRRLYEKWESRRAFYAESATVDELADMIRGNDLERFKRCINKSPDLASKSTYYDFTLLHLAVMRQRHAFIPLLLSLAPSTLNKVDRRDNYNSETALAAFAPPTLPHTYVKVATPLHYACLVGDIECIRLLLEAGADWEVKEHKGRTAEELIYEEGVEGQRVKEEFVRLRTVAEERREKKDESVVVEDVNVAEAEAKECAEKRVIDVRDDKSVVKKDTNETVEDSRKLNSAKPEESITKVDPKDKVTESPKKTLRPLEVVLSEKLVGQRGPIRAVTNALRLREAGWVDPERPLVLLFLGSSGVGKTELAKQVALHMYEKEGHSLNGVRAVERIEQEFAFTRIDMSEYQQVHSVSNMMGSPKGYVGYEDEGFLSSRLRKNPRAIVLLDEIEKAHPDVLTVFLQLFDDGRITDSKNGVVFCKDAVFILTSNLASDEIKANAPALRKLVAETEAQGRLEEYLRVVGLFTRAVHPILKKELKRDEFLGRINQMIVFLPLSDEEVHDVVKSELKTWRTRADENHQIKLSWSKEVVEKLASAYDVNYGVRSVANETQRIAVQLIADAHLQGQLFKGWNAYLTTNDLGDIVLKATDFKDDSRYRRGCRFMVP